MRRCTVPHNVQHAVHPVPKRASLPSLPTSAGPLHRAGPDVQGAGEELYEEAEVVVALLLDSVRPRSSAPAARKSAESKLAITSECTVHEYSMRFTGVRSGHLSGRPSVATVLYGTPIHHTPQTTHRFTLT